MVYFIADVVFWLIVQVWGLFLQGKLPDAPPTILETETEN